jgi:superfamily I DNA and/or RNA helicase
MVTEPLIEPVDTGTVHRFQGREWAAVIFSTVLDETWRGQTGLSFVDDAHLINVAVSRAVKKFILVINHDMLPRSRYIRELVTTSAIRAPVMRSSIAGSCRSLTALPEMECS